MIPGKFHYDLSGNEVGFFKGSLTPCNFDVGDSRAQTRKTHHKTGGIRQVMRFLVDRSGRFGQLRFRNVSWGVAERYCPLAMWCLCPMTRQKAWKPLRCKEPLKTGAEGVGMRTFRRERPWGEGRSHRHPRLNRVRVSSRKPGWRRG